MLLMVGIVFLGLLLVAAFAIGVYNSLIRLRNQMKEAWSGIDVQLKRRSDLIPNLVETVKGYAGHEQSVLENVTKFRSQVTSAASVHERMEAENGLTQTLKSLFAVAENYPDLKANQNFIDLQRNLDEIEEQIQLSRRYYNGTVRDYNNQVESFPSNLVAGMANFKTAEFFELENAAEREAPKVAF